MTVCIAALCEERKALVLATDRMVRSTRFGTEAEFHKTWRLHKDWWLMLAGDDVAPAFDIIDAVKKKLDGQDRFSVDDVERAVTESHREKRAAEAEAKYLIPRGWTLDRFSSSASTILPEPLCLSLDNDLQSYGLDIELLIAGFDAEGRAHVFSVNDDDNRGAARRHDVPGFFAIGCGSPGAYFMMMYRAMNPSVPIRWGIFHVLEAKHFGALVPGVGPGTDMYVLRHRKATIQVQEKMIESKLIRFCRDLEPPTLTQKHVSALNQIGGIDFRGIKKLSTVPQNRSTTKR